MRAPLGIIGFFETVSENPNEHQEELMVIIHVAFWLLLFFGAFLRETLPLVWLRVLWAVLVASLVMTIGGCARQIGPGMGNPGNWH